jgi:hypothetical protein
MHDLNLFVLVTEFFRADPFRAFGVIGLFCIAVSMATSFDALRLFGFADVEEEQDGEATVA